MKYSKQHTKEISFPIGGIGTGCIGLGGDGRLIDWEIFNKPNKGSVNRYSHFAIRAIQNDKITSAVLNGDMTKELIGQYNKHQWSWNTYGSGANHEKMCGFPHFGNVEFTGEFPVASIDFKDDKFPANVVMTAFNPFIPCDCENSSLPSAFFEFEVENITSANVKYQIAFSVANPYEKSVNKSDLVNGFRTLTLFNSGVDKEDINYGDLTLATDCRDSSVQTYWYRGEFQDGLVTFWKDFSSNLKINDRTYDAPGICDMGTLIAEINVCPGEKKKVRFILSWNIPNNYNYWNEYKNEDGTHKTWKNYYATVFEDSVKSAVYALKNWDDLYNRTMKFKKTLHESTLPKDVIDAASSNLSVLKSPTVLRLEDGSLYGWEGVAEQMGLCEGTCQHVWNYAYALCFLFPELERSIRDFEFKYSLDDKGRLVSRTNLPLGREMFNFRPCIDGQMGEIIKCYREWKISGDSKWIAGKWDGIKKIIEYAWSDDNKDFWDNDKDGVLEGRQFHTLDMDIFGPSSWLEGMYLLALKAASEIASFMGDTEKEAEYRGLFEKGYEWTRENLFNGKYFIQKVDITDKEITDKFGASEKCWNEEVGQIKYQIASGSSIDQMLAQWHSGIIGLGEVFDENQISSALSEMMKNNFKPTMRDFVNHWRVFSINDEAGTIICDYPDEAEKPQIPISYSEETMTGFEYAFAGLLCLQGKIDDGLKVVKAIRDRFDGEKRNPWNEFECGSNYARSMASFALVPILSGFSFDMTKGYIGFNPKVNSDDFRSVFSIGNSWGQVEIKKNEMQIEIYGNALTLQKIGTPGFAKVNKVTADGKEIDFEFKDGLVLFDAVTVSKELKIYE